MRRDDELEYCDVMETEVKKVSIQDIDHFIRMELYAQKQIFEQMACDEEMIEKTLEQMRLTFLSHK